ncbi:unnamed protein product [Rotaria socialis]|uniref:Uncharacterized protein n=2 Tax=Rotaria socialis TaxID=392032 RepID=A0A818WP05_9BILA|nr:unnamed protein product [Rotaria socialis]
MHNNFIVIEVWDKKISGPADKIIGIVKISLEQFYTSFKDKGVGVDQGSGWDGMGRNDSSRPIVWDFQNKNLLPSHPMGPMGRKEYKMTFKDLNRFP